MPALAIAHACLGYTPSTEQQMKAVAGLPRDYELHHIGEIRRGRK